MQIRRARVPSRASGCKDTRKAGKPRGASLFLSTPVLLSVAEASQQLLSLIRSGVRR